MTQKGTVRLETERLVLRRFVLSDAEAMYSNWANDKEVTKYLTWPVHKDMYETEGILKSWIEQHEKDDYYSWAIIEKQIDAPIGSIAAVGVDANIDMVHIGYCLGRCWWNQGYMSEALKAVVRFFFEEVGVNRVESRHDPRNIYSGRVMMSAGLQYEGTKKQGDRNNQGICDSMWYALVAEDYYKTLD
ncbi:MAG: GNAT family N-acetyltransferase [Oscillospiraceae bacterium]|nr:GNAT family N-acetyltransferase [Oscillospiraceae bacterium]